MNDISKEELFIGLLGYGLFADKIPPVFSSKAFADFCMTELSSGRSLLSDGKRNDYVRYDSIRNISIPRPMGIPNPFKYALLCKSLSDNWPNLQEYFKEVTNSQKYKVSRIHIRKLKNTAALFEMNYKNPSIDGDGMDNIVMCSKYRVAADISNCFPSIYTHAIPWAIKGKPASKMSISHWSDAIDQRCREIKFDETSGVLIGPHSSNLISEIILCRIDQLLIEDGFQNFTRCIDDYSCYVPTMEDAERFLLKLNEHLKDYELSINHKKTQIVPLPETSETDWVYRLNSIYLGGEYTADGKHILPLSILKTYIDVALSLTLERKEATPINYAIKVISTKYLGLKAKQFYIKRLLHLVYSFPYLAPLIDKYVFQPFSVEKEIIRDYIKALYQYGKEHNTFEASSYSLYWAIKYGVPFDDYENADEIIRSKDCIYMLLSYLYAKNIAHDKANINKYKKEALRLRDNDPDRFWLFVYEVLPMSELKGQFKNIKKNKISFITL